ncbi:MULTISPECIES: aldo/keto reductase [unclassified Halomonas]|uniref:aldo/keto reductase n=1 Tax=unclassified Halomonas TaxID=2609666 RepID=UPI00047F5D51|nr:MULTISPECIES: aldo/keto reductase [unclassified Halomonas]NAO97729.1 aldo/keto reductase [Halomonas sp. MG34]PKH62694.1 aldo/keto reductase [Halomonas sp. Choline-3u-9]QGQ69142.1 aldo/keto reductase [Halomonas sp. PA16-9]
MQLDHYRLLGRSGLKISPMALGTMTFGTEWNFGADESTSRALFDRYVDHGGNFIDTANYYTGGTSESFVGRFAQGKRDRLVIATKYTLPMRGDDPNSGGNSRRSMVRSVEDSLTRLGSDYIDLLYLHAWDFTTPVEEILRAMDDLVAAGKVVYLGLSDIPSWQASRMQAIADLRGWSPMVAMQLEYNLIERSVEGDLVPMAREMGMGIMPWSPLASGLLTGKYNRAALVPENVVSGSRAAIVTEAGPVPERSFRIIDEVKQVATEQNTSPATVALAWLLTRPGMAAPLIGARSISQLEANLAALELELTGDQLARLDEVSAVPLGFPHEYLRRPAVQANIYGDMSISMRG